MNATRVAFLIRNFWPAISHSQTLCADLASGMAQRGMDVRVITSKLGFDWSGHMAFRDVPVVRLATNRPMFWGKSHYQQLLGQTLDQEPPMHVVIVWGLGEELEFAVREFKGKGTRIIARLDHDSLRQHCSEAQLPRRWKQLLAKTDLILVNARSLLGLLERQGISEHKVQYFADAVEPCLPQLDVDRDPPTARRILSKIHPLLDIAPNQKLVVTHSSLAVEQTFLPLLHVWRLFLKTYPTAKWVILGDGPAAHGIWNRVHNFRLTHSVVMPGWFDDWDPFLFAADAYLDAEYTAGVDAGVIRAVARGVPTLAWRQPDLEAALSELPNDCLIPAGQVSVFAEQLVRLSADRSWNSRVRALLRQTCGAEVHWTNYLDQFQTCLSTVTSHVVTGGST